MAPGRVEAGAGRGTGARGRRTRCPLPGAARTGLAVNAPRASRPSPCCHHCVLAGGGRGTWKLSETLRTHARSLAERRSKGSYLDFLAAARRPREGRHFTHLWYSRLAFVFPEAVSVKPAPRSRVGRRARIV